MITKGDPSFLEQVGGFPGRGRFFLAVTIEGPPEVLDTLSPRAPAYESRLDALRWAVSLGLPAMVRLDPVIPPLWRALYGGHWTQKAVEVMADCAAAGAGHVVSSMGRFTAATRNALAAAVADINESEGAALHKDYAYDRSYTSSGYMLRHELRLALHRSLRTAAQELGMTYAVCQELRAEEADTPGLPHCEAYAMPFSRRVGEREFAPIAGCTANCFASCAGLADPPCRRPELARTQPYGRSLLVKRTSKERVTSAPPREVLDDRNASPDRR